jgi:hypothetical protein
MKTNQQFLATGTTLLTASGAEPARNTRASNALRRRKALFFGYLLSATTSWTDFRARTSWNHTD